MSADSTQRQKARVVGILAGGGELPREVAEGLRDRGCGVVVVALEGEADNDFKGFPVTRLGWGKVGGMIRAFRAGGARDIIIIGRVSRPDLKRIRPDLGFLLGVPELLALMLRGGGDDRVLRAVIRFFERRGLRVAGLPQLVPHLIVGRGLAGAARPTSADVADMALAAAVLAALSPFDVGQGVVVAEGRVEAVEAAENTDAMLERVAVRRRAEGRNRRVGVLVKLTKRGQERRIDLPAIGQRTALGAAAAGLAGIGVEAGGVVVVRREETMARADAAGVFIAGIDGLAPATGEAPGIAPTPADAADTAWRVFGAAKASARVLGDAERGAEVMAAVAPFQIGRAVVLSRRYVLGVEAGEGVEALLGRVGGLRQWGARGSRRRSGVVVLATLADLTPHVAALAAEAGLAAIAIADDGGGIVGSAVLEAARHARIVVLGRAGHSTEAGA